MAEQSLLFKHTDQEEAYSWYAIKNGDLLDEDTINLFCQRLKKEVDDVYNLLCAFAGLPLQEYNSGTEYEKGEIVRFDDGNGYKNYIARGITIGHEPTDPVFWTEFTKYSETQSMTKLSDYLTKYNQEAYDPGSLQADETGVIDYHPATVKFVEDRIAAALNTQYADLLKRIEALESK